MFGPLDENEITLVDWRSASKLRRSRAEQAYSSQD